MIIKSTVENSIAKLVLEGALDISTVQIFKDEVKNIHKVTELIIDFNELSFIDSTGIGSLNQVLNMLNEVKTIFTIKNISEDVYEVLELLGLVEIFGKEIFEPKKH